MKRTWLAVGCIVSGAAFVTVMACDGKDGGGPTPELDSSTVGDGSMRDGAPGDGPDATKALGTPRVYVGSGDGKIRLYAFDADTCALTLVENYESGQRPYFLAFDPAVRFLYAIDAQQAQVNVFGILPSTGKLTPLQSGVGSGGDGPAHIAVDRAGKFVMVANYGGGTATIFPRQTDGTIGAGKTLAFGAQAHTHQIVTEPSNAFAFVPNLGLDTVAALALGTVDFADAGVTRSGEGPRHIDFDPHGRYAYVIDELGATVSAFALNAATGALSPIQTISSLPDGYSGRKWAAEIQVLPDGRHLIASNRADDSLMVFDIDAANGTLTQSKRVPSGGKTPRHFQVDQTGRFLFVGNEESANVVVMKIDASTGVPSPVGTPVSVPSPGYVGLVYVDP